MCSQDPGAGGGSAGAVGAVDARLSNLLLLVVVCSSLQPSSATPILLPNSREVITSRKEPSNLGYLDIRPCDKQFPIGCTYNNSTGYPA